MADNDRAPEPVDALKTERADSAYEFPTSDSMASSAKGDAPSTQGSDGDFRSASRAWDASDNASSSSDVRSRAKVKFADVQDAVTRKYRGAADSTDDFVHENPWKAITIAALAGVVVGMLASR